MFTKQCSFAHLIVIYLGLFDRSVIVKLQINPLESVYECDTHTIKTFRNNLTNIEQYRVSNT